MALVFVLPKSLPDYICTLMVCFRWALSTAQFLFGQISSKAGFISILALLLWSRAFLSAAETVQGLERLAIIHQKTLPYSAYQNGKQEVLWSQVEGRLLAMLENCIDLTLTQLNEATLAWIELEYNRKVHSEIAQTPLDRYAEAKDVGRPCPESEQLRQAFRAQLSRAQRQSDGTLSVEGIRFELPSRYRHLNRVSVRFASWDLSHVYLADPRSARLLCRLYPQDKPKNADARRRSKQHLIDAGPPLHPRARRVAWPPEAGK